jgi:CheY-like chemotaxis protein
LVHGIRQTEQALNLVVHLPYELIIIDSEMLEMSGIDYMRGLQNAREWPTIKLVLITNPLSTGFAGEAAKRGAFLARKARWKDDLCGFLSAYDEG